MDAAEDIADATNSTDVPAADADEEVDEPKKMVRFLHNLQFAFSFLFVCRSRSSKEVQPRWILSLAMSVGSPRYAKTCQGLTSI